MLFSFGFDVGDEGRVDAGASGLINYFAFIPKAGNFSLPANRYNFETGAAIGTHENH